MIGPITKSVKEFAFSQRRKLSDLYRRINNQWFMVCRQAIQPSLDESGSSRAINGATTNFEWLVPQ
jgi:hypothetical protein